MQPTTPFRSRRPAERAALREWCLLALLLALSGGLLGYAGGLGRPDQTLYDAAITLMPQSPSADVVIIAIDEPSLAQIGRWPWPRAVHAALLDKLQPIGTRAIGLDLILAEPEQSGADGPGDRALAQAIKRAGNVVLPVLMEPRTRDGQRQLHASVPVPMLAESAAALGHIHLEIDSDGIARSVFLREGQAQAQATGGPAWPHFALALRNVGSGAPLADLPGERAGAPASPQTDPGRWLRDYWMHIRFAGPPGTTFTQLSYADVLKGAVPAGRLAGKYVLIGATAAGLGDAFPTPVSGRSRPMPGIEISANVLDALLQGRSIVRASGPANAAFSVAPVLLLMTALLLFSPRRGLLCAAAMLPLTLGASFLLLRGAGLWFAPAAALLGLVLAYPLWSWRRLEATVQYLGDEFLRIDAEPRILPDAPEGAAAAPPGADLVERRIIALGEAAERLRDARRFVSDTLESLPDAALVADRDGTVLLANRAALRLLAPRAAGAGPAGGSAATRGLRGARVADLIAAFLPKTGNPQPLAWEQLQALAAPRALPAAGAPAVAPAVAPAPASIELAGPDGADLLARCAPCTSAAGALAGWIVSLIDITPLREAERSRDEVLAFLSHDMRSPQSSILALLELHELDPEDNPKQDVHLRIAQYARRTLELSEQFLQLARAATKEYEFDTVDLGVIAEEAVEETWAAAEQKRITLQLRFDGEPVPVRAEPSLLRRALINLLGNAVKYSPEGTVTTIRVDSRDGWSECEIVDQGYGMSADNLSHLFERFRRFSRPGQPKAQGAGLGMAFVKTVIEKHGGSIQVDSAPGEGSRFLLRLPPAAT